MSKKHKNQDELGGWQEKLMLSSQGKRLGYAKNESADAHRMRVRVRIVNLLMLVMGVGVLSRMLFLTVFERGKYHLKSENNNIEHIRQYASRGVILDQLGRKMVENTGDERGGRKYLLGEQAAHLLGYMSQVREDELGCEYGLCYYLGDWTGRTGVEKVYESRLKGRDGGKVVELDVKGATVRELGVNEAEQGTDVTLSINSELQRIVAEAVGERKGGVVALDMQGKVMALYSGPSYDPNLFTVQSDEVEKQALLRDKESEYFLNRVTSGVYAPGSVFKLVTAYAGLESGEIDQETLIEDTGEIVIDQYRYGNWYFDQYGKTEGEINLERALARSNDIFFYRLGEKVGVDEIVSWASKMGLGERTGIELPGESEGLVPTRLWKERTTGERWFLGNTYHLSIGQGDLTATPLQIARMTLAAVSGRRCQVSLLQDSEVECVDLGISSKNIEIVKSGMRAACATGGTAFSFFEFGPYVLCKTGTAQHAGQTSDEVLPHAWITVAYPGDNPEMILTVMLDSAGEGSYEAGPVAKEILGRWQEVE